jgi:hypothetical protein
MAAALVRGEVVAAAIHDPICDDTALALRGEGAWTEAADGARSELHVAAAVPVAEMTGNVSWRYLPEPRRGIVCANLPRLGGSWDYRCAAHEYRGVRRPLPPAVLQPAAAVGPRSGLAAAPGGRRLLRAAGRQRVFAAAERWRADLRAGSGELGGGTGGAGGGLEVGARDLGARFVGGFVQAVDLALELAAYTFLGWPWCGHLRVLIQINDTTYVEC